MKYKILNFWNWFGDNRQKFEVKPQKEIMLEIYAEIEKNFEPDNFLIGITKEGKYDFVIVSYKKTHRYICKAFEDLMPESLKDKWQVSRYVKGNSDEIISINNLNLTLNDFEVSYKINSQNSVLDIEIYSKYFKLLQHNACKEIAFIMLDNALGDLIVEDRIGSVKILTKQKGLFTKNNGMPLTKFSKTLFEICKQNNWDLSQEPTETYYLYKHFNFGNKNRTDTITGINTCRNLFNESRKEINELEEMQVYLYFAKIPSEISNSNNIIDIKESQLKDFLIENKLGYVIGHAIGKSNYYLDFMILDNSEYQKRISDINDIFKDVMLLKL